MIRIVLLSILLAVAACATTPVPSAGAPAASASAVLDPTAVVPRDGAGAIMVTRDKGFVGSACAFNVLLDGKPVVALKAGERTTIYAEPGERVVGVGNPCYSKALRQLAVNVTAGQTKKVRIGVAESMDLLIEPSAL